MINPPLLPAALPRVLMVTREQLADRRYGLGRSLLPVVEALTTQGWTVRYLCQHDLQPAQLAKRQQWFTRLGRWLGVATHSPRQAMLWAWLERLQMGWFAARVAQQQGFDRVHLHDPWLAIGFWAGARRHALTATRWGITEHGFGSYSQATHDDGLAQGVRAQQLFRWLERRVLAAADWVIAPTRLSLEALARDLTLPAVPAHWRTLPHPRRDFVPMDKAAARAALGWSSTGQYVLGVGRCVPLKRFDLLLAACLALAERHPQLQVQILGEGDHAALQAQADAAGFGHRLHFAATDDVTPYLYAADCYVSTSSTESFGLANLEALAAGLPTVCTAVGGVPEVMAEGAWLIPGSAAVLARVLDTLLSEESTRQAWAHRAQAQAARWPDLTQITEAYAALYQN